MAQNIAEKVALLLAKAEGTDQDTYIVRELFVLWHGEGPWLCCFCQGLIEELGGNRKDGGLVHHLNGDHKDNRLENVAAAHHGCHTSHHNAGKSRTGALNGMFGNPHSEETKQKLRDAAVGRPSSRKGAVLSEETKQKLREAQLKSWARRKAGAADV